MDRKPAILALASFFKGNRFLEAAKREGANVYLLTIEKLLTAKWARDSIDEVFALPIGFGDRRELVAAVSYLVRSRPIDRVVALDDYDVEVAAFLREHMRLPGMGETTARYFRDKLAMREKAHDNGVRVPPFTPILDHDRIRKFLDEVPGPWVLKPRSEASSVGIRRIYKADDVWPVLEELGDDQSYYLIEKMIPGDVYHVDSIVSEKEIVFAACHRYRRPLLGVVHDGGIFGTRTVARGSEEERELLAFHEKTVKTLGLVRGVAHTEFIRSRDDGQFYFLETGARVGGAHIADLVLEESGVDLWGEWAKIELAHKRHAYTAPTPRKDTCGLIISLARAEKPDISAYTDEEIVWRLDMANHVGFIVRAETTERVDEVMTDLEARIARDFQAVLPAPSKALD